MSTRKKQCGKGHALTPENTYLRGGTEPICRMCQRAYQAAYRARCKERGDVAVRLPRPSTTERLFAQINKLPNGCWEWTGYINKEGYGRTYFKGNRSVPAYQAMYRHLIGPVPEGKTLDHTCHTNDASCAGGVTCLHRRCVNPAHLEPVTEAENTRRSRSFSSLNALKTHCPKGHAYDEENTLVSNGRRYCRTCQRASAAAHQARKKAVAA